MAKDDQCGDMRRLGALSEEDLELLIEREILRDPDAGLELKAEFKRRLGRLKEPASVDQDDVMRRFGGG
jgi:hypothetical protein